LPRWKNTGDVSGDTAQLSKLNERLGHGIGESFSRAR
jgi:hypothetical protein